MATPAKHRVYTIEQYVSLEEYSNVKHEFLHGQIYAMAGGTLEHSALAANVAGALVAQLREKRCRVYTSAARVRVVATGLDTRPDVSVACGGEERDSEDRNALVNPVVLVEVTSASTEDYDRGEKLEHYRRIPALREVVLVSHREAELEVWRRGDGDARTRETVHRGERVQLASIGCTLDVGEIYRDPFAESAP